MAEIIDSGKEIGFAIDHPTATARPARGGNQIISCRESSMTKDASS